MILAWACPFKLELCGSHFCYVMDAILDFMLNTMSKNISRNITMSGMLIKKTLHTKMLMYVSLWYNISTYFGEYILENCSFCAQNEKLRLASTLVLIMTI